MSSAVAVLGLAITGCGNNSNTSGNNSSKSSNASGQNSSNGSNTSTNSTSSGQSSTATKPLNILPTPAGTYQENFNPFSTTADYGTLMLLYEQLFYFDAETGKTVPYLGKSFKWSNSNKTLTVQLNTQAKWSDGQPFTAQDVVYTFQVLKQHPSLDRNGVWQKLSSVKAQGNSTVVFQFNKPNVPFQYYVLSTIIVPKHIWKNISNPGKTTNKHPIGTGPYTLKSFSPQVIKYKANPNYYKGKPPVPEVDLPAYSGNTSANLALAQGKIDWTGQFIPNIKKVYTSKSPTNHYWFPPAQIFSLVPNWKNPLLSNKTVREAMSLAIDRNALSKKAEDGYEQVAQPDAVSPSQSSWIDPNLPAADKKFTYDPTKAQQLLKKAGFKKNSSGVFVSPSGKKLSFNLMTHAGWTDWDMEASMIAEDLKKIGIQIKVSQEQGSAFTQKLQNHNFDLAVDAAYGGPNPYYVFDSMLRTNGASNWGAYANKKVDQALNDFSQTTDKTKQKQAIYSIEKTFAQDLPQIPLVYGATWYEYSTAHYTGFPDKSHAYISPSPWDREAVSYVLMHLKPTH